MYYNFSNQKWRQHKNLELKGQPRLQETQIMKNKGVKKEGMWEGALDIVIYQAEQ